MNNKYIGVFDSGIGGLTVVKSIIEALPNENIIYFGDTLNSPYGDKKEEEIISLALEDVKFLKNFDIKAIVIACNTADSVAKEKIKQMNTLPVFGVVEPASKYAISITKNNKIGVIATKATINSKSYLKCIGQINKDVKVYSKACPLLVPLVEQGKFTSDDIQTKQVLQEYLSPLLLEGIDTLILGCTHYPLLINFVKQIAPNINIISSSDCAANEIKKSFIENDMLADKYIDRKYYVSSDIDRFKSLANIFMDNFNEQGLLK